MNCYRCATPVPENSRFCQSCGADLSGETGERTLAAESDPELEARLQEDLGSEFTIERQIGRGGMAAVYLASDEHLGRMVAIKVLPPELTYGGGLIERFRREARTAATLAHPHIIPIYRISTSGKLFWYAMQYLEGESLADLLSREGALPVGRAAEIVAQVSDALAYAHERGVIHRDIKPANIMLGAKGWVTVTDFGIAKASGTESLTGSGAMVGTPYYMSPEQCSGERKVAAASDQYSLAVVAYQMLSGHLPFTGESVVDIVKKHCMDPVPPLAVLRPEAPPVLVAVVERALAKAPEERFPGVAAFAQAFARAAGGEAVDVGPRGEWPAAEPARRSVTTPASPVPAAPGSRPGGRRGRRRAVLWIVTGLVGVAGAGLAIWPQLRTRSLTGAGGGTAQPIPESVVTAETTRSLVPPVAILDTTPRMKPPVETTSAGPRSDAVLVLRGVPAGAIVGVDGHRVFGSPIPLRPGVEHVVGVVAAGYAPWTVRLRPREGEHLERSAELRALPQAAVRPPPPETAAQRPARPAVHEAPTAAATVARETQPPPESAPRQAAPAPSGPAYVTVGSRPLAAMSINGRPAPSNPVSNYEVPAGRVRLQFQVTDSSGVWSFDTTVVVGSGDRRNFGFIRLVRRP